MYINQENSDTPYAIKQYSSTSIMIGHQVLTHAFLLTPSSLLPTWPTESFSDLTEKHLAPIFLKPPEILLIGTGKAPQQLAPALRYCIESQGIGVECMNTAAACRSYTILLSEQRNVAALLFLC